MQFPPQTVVVPVDFSDESFAAVDTALQIAAAPASVHVVHVLPEMQTADPGVVWQAMDVEIRRKHASAELRNRLAGESHHRRPGDDRIRRSRIPHFGIAQDLGADLIVMPSHGRTGLKRIMIGSVAERVVRLAHCPVLVLRH